MRYLLLLFCFPICLSAQVEMDKALHRQLVENLKHEKDSLLLPVALEFSYKTGKENAKLEAISSYLLAQKEYTSLEIDGHTDCQGEVEEDLAYMERVLGYIKGYMLEKGIDSTRVITTSYGKNRLIEHCVCETCTEEQHAKNRRLVLRVGAVELSAEMLIKEAADRFSAAFVAEDYETMMASYTEDAKIFASGLDILSGQEQIRSYWVPNSPKKSKVIYHKLSPQEIKVVGNEAYDWGYYEGITLREDGTESKWRGKYVVIWREVAPGDWRMYLDIWNGIN